MGNGRICRATIWKNNQKPYFREDKNTVDVHKKHSYLRMKKLNRFDEKKQPDQETLLGHYFIAELDGDSQTGWKGQAHETAELFPFPKRKGEAFILS